MSFLVRVLAFLYANEHGKESLCFFISILCGVVFLNTIYAKERGNQVSKMTLGLS